jgi:hypothetical protein
MGVVVSSFKTLPVIVPVAEVGGGGVGEGVPDAVNEKFCVAVAPLARVTVAEDELNPVADAVT